MARPVVAELTDRWFDALPGIYRAADAVTDPDPVNGWPLLRFLALLGDQADEIAVLAARLALHDDGTGDWISELASPVLADAAWLDWLAQFVGVVTTPDMTAVGKRAAIENVVWLQGTPQAIIAALEAVLEGTQRVTLVEQFDGDPNVIAVWVYAAETPDPEAADAIARAATPAWLAFAGGTVTQPGLTWYDASRQFASWGDMAAGGATWAARASQVPTY